ncbi:MAG: Fur family transcriptional regulator [Bacteroidota bacterium]
MEQISLDQVFRENNLKRTKLRIALLGCLINAKHAQSYIDLKERLGIEVDKSTLYRNLSAFEEAGIIHRINDHSGVSKYAFGKVDNHEGNHAHFVCEQCETVFCVEENLNFEIKVPKGFKTRSVQTIITGICSAC